MYRFLAALALVLAFCSTQSFAISLKAMKVTRQALNEKPSLEVIVNRIRDIQQAQELTRVMLFETPISVDSKWALNLGKMTKSKADSIMQEMRKSGVYKDQERAILSLRFMCGTRRLSN